MSGRNNAFRRQWKYLRETGTGALVCLRSYVRKGGRDKER